MLNQKSQKLTTSSFLLLQYISDRLCRFVALLCVAFLLSDVMSEIKSDEYSFSEKNQMSVGGRVRTIMCAVAHICDCVVHQ